MSRKWLSLFLVGLLFYGVNPQIILAQTSADNSAERNRVERIKTNIYRLEDAGKTRVVVYLKTGAKVKGYITNLGEDSFDVTNYKTQQTTAVAYRDVAEVKEQGSSKGAKLALGIGVVAAIAVLLIVLPHKGGSGGFCPISCSPL